MASVKSQRKEVLHIYRVWLCSLKDSIFTGFRLCWCVHLISTLKMSQGDLKFISSSEEVLLHQSTVMIWPTVILCFLFCFHLTPLWKQLFSVAFLILTMLCYICSECELKQALMCCGTLFLTYMVECYMLWASPLFEEQWGTEPEASWNGVDAHEFKVDENHPRCWLFYVSQHGWLSKCYAWAQTGDGSQLRSDSACLLSAHRECVQISQRSVLTKIT